MSQMYAKDYPIKWIALNELSVVWLDAQRPLDLRAAKRIADAFDPDALDPLTVTLPNGDGVYHIIDGQTRHAAVRMLWEDDHQRIPCRVLDARTKKEAARIWRTMNHGHKKPSAIHTHRVGVTAGDPDCLAVEGIASDLGFKIQEDNADGVIAAVGALHTVYRKHGDAGLTWTLGTIEETWGKDREAYNGYIIQGYGEVFGKHRNVLDRKRLVRVVEKQYTPGRLIGAAKTAREMFKGTLPTNIVQLLEAAYNHNLRNAPRLEA